MVFNAEPPINKGARSGKAESARLEDEGADAGNDGGEVDEQFSTSSDETPLPQTEIRNWRRKTRRRYMNTFFVFEEENHSE